MSAQKTDRVLTCYRIGDPKGAYPIYDSQGARLYPGRWNTPASPIIYTSEYYSTAMLEKLVHANSVIPPNQHYIRITIPNGTSYETARRRFCSTSNTLAGQAGGQARGSSRCWRASRACWWRSHSPTRRRGSSGRC